MKIIFMGTPDFAVPTLKNLIEQHEVLAVVTQPDKPRGRGKKVTFSPVKEEAMANNIDVLQPEKVRNEDFINTLREYDADVFVVIAYGKILPESILDIPKYGCINVHGSLLPKYRGAAPIQWAIIDGETVTGVTIMYMDKGMDTGDIVLKRELSINPEDNAGTIHDKMSILGADVLLEALAQIEGGTSSRTKQNDDLATYAKMLTKDMGCIDFNKSTADILNLIRGLNPWPTAYTFYNEDMIKIWSAQTYDNTTKFRHGEIIDILPQEGIIVQANDGTLLITEIQASNGKRMLTTDYLRGNKLETNIVLGAKKLYS